MCSVCGISRSKPCSCMNGEWNTKLCWFGLREWNTRWAKRFKQMIIGYSQQQRSQTTELKHYRRRDRLWWYWLWLCRHKKTPNGCSSCYKQSADQIRKIQTTSNFDINNNNNWEAHRSEYSSSRHHIQSAPFETCRRYLFGFQLKCIYAMQLFW